MTLPVTIKHENGCATGELLRHADIQTTLNIYTQAVSDAKREANSIVVRMVLPGFEQAKRPLLAASRLLGANGS